MVAVSISNLRPVVNQCSLFDTGKNRNLSNALDKIHDRFGENTVYKGRMWGTEGQAVDRIGYRKL
jgi:hypothetical protein